MGRDPLDPQKHLVYEWEDQFRSFGERTLTRAQARRLVRRICRKWCLPAPRLRFMRKGKREWSYVEGRVLAVNYSMCNEAIVCHEMAHYYWDQQLGNDLEEIHGEEFFGVYLDMLVFAEVAPRVALEASALAIGLEWIP